MTKKPHIYGVTVSVQSAKKPSSSEIRKAQKELERIMKALKH